MEVVKQFGELAKTAVYAPAKISTEALNAAFDEGNYDGAVLLMSTREPDGSFEIDGSTTVRDLNRFGDWSLPDDEAATIAGLVIHEAQTIPTVGQVFVFHGFRFEILSRERHQIKRIRMKEATEVAA